MGVKKQGVVVLVNPNYRGNYVQGAFAREHLGLGLLSAELKQSGFKAEIIDSRITGQIPEDAAKEILEQKPNLVGFSLIAKEACNWCGEVARRIKEENKDTHIAVGNYFPSLQPERALESIPNADSVVIGEGDLTFSELASCIITGKNWQNTKGIAYRTNGKTQINSRRELIKDLDELPFPEHYGSRFQLNEFAIEGSRGCYMKCTFCSINPFFEAGLSSMKWRSRSPNSIAAEISANLKGNSIRVFRFVDPDFIGAPGQEHIERLKELVREFEGIKPDFEFIIDTRTKLINAVPIKLWQDLKCVGLKEVYLGVETASPHIKKMMRKDSTFKEDCRAIETLESQGIMVRYGFMMITPWTTEDDIEPNARALHQLGFPRLDKYFQEMYVVPRTEAVELTKKITNIWFDGNGEGEYYTYGLPPAVDNLRRLSRSLVGNCLGFLGQYQALHEGVRKCLEEPSVEDTEIFKKRINDLSMDFFLTVFDRAKGLDVNVSDETVKDLARDIVKDYQPRLDQLEQDFKSRNNQEEAAYGECNM